MDDGHFVCSRKDCHEIVSKAKQTRVKAICPHLHLLKCALKLRSDKDVTKQEEQDVQFPANVSVNVIPDVVADEQVGNESISRRLSVLLALSRKIPYNVSKDVLECISKMDANCLLGLVDKGWPKEFVPHNTACQLCNSDLSSAISIENNIQSLV